ncbi:haloacid dehalogenase-like hydrolase [Streptomyces hirsutus]|uniref:HAD family hydrolase n=2 Tax=Streptomyces TaxID=1883 RepID=A0ABX6AT64_9ACTN|nr:MULTISPECIES: HAD family hydrolase [Streptomyces]QEV04896.1 HAD family hydrolase [Streptomyces prasinus]WSD04924.1 haloacid dehalogenase-like hydrolase [Streptomyces hirsutus]WTD21683.1 haloacid dehalogenase-like hydrolase [Streptomyces hirsutus]
MILVLWDIDRTLLYTGDTDRLVYRELFEEVVGRPAESLPARGTGVTMPLAVRELLRANAVEPERIEELAQRIVQRMPAQLERHRNDLSRTGQIMPGAPAVLAAVQQEPGLVPTVVTGNLRGSAEIKLKALGLDKYLDLIIGGYSSDDSHRPALVRVAQQRAGARHGYTFARDTTVIIGDSLEDVRTGREGGAHVIGVASGTTSVEKLAAAGACHVIPELTDTRCIIHLINQCVAPDVDQSCPDPSRGVGPEV